MSDVWFLRQALADLRAAHGSYEEQRPGLADEFADVVDAAVASIIAFPTARPVVYRETRRPLVERFTSCLYYRIHGDQTLMVVACLHVALDPQRHQSRLRG